MMAVPCRILLIMLLVLAPNCGSASENLAGSRKKLAEIEQRISRASEELAGKKSAARTLSDDLGVVERELTGIKRRVARLEAREMALARETAAEEVEVRRAKEAVAEREGLVRKRLAALYKSGDMGFLRVLFAPEAPARRAEQYDYLGRIVRRDRELIATYRQEVAAREKALLRLKALRGEQRAVLDGLRAERQALERAGRLKRDLLARLQRDQRALASRLEELRQGAVRLQGLIKKLESAQTGEYTQPAGSFAARKGRLSWPSAGQLTAGFGRHRHPELGTLVDSQGYEIEVTDEAPVTSIWAGRVIFANRFKGYGNLLIVDHGDGYYSLYAKGGRLTKKVGDPVAAGETIALAGDGENLYFEIRHRGSPLDPADWLAPR